jgi:hypothetical protein
MSTPHSSVLERIDQVCDRYEAARLAGQRPRIDDYLREVPEAERSELLRELLRLEQAYLQDDQRRRWQRGERVSVKAYLEEAPSLRDYPDLVFELVCGEVLLRGELRESPRLADYLDLVPTHQAQLRRMFVARHLLPPETLQGLSDRATLRGAKQATVVEAQHTVDELPPPASEPASAAPAPRGEAVLAPPGYEVLGKLGEGGMGVVYKARQVNADRLVALKMIRHSAHAGPAELARFRTEAEAIARLQHPHVVQVFEVGEHNGLPFFSLEFCPGGSLDKKLAGTPLTPQEAAALVALVAQGVQAAHEAKVLHRDLKPANVLLAADRTPKVTDFGLAKKLDAQGVTLPGVVMGTPSYMAPEQASGEVAELGPAVDVYALGAILYECLTGRPPFRAATVLQTLQQVQSDEPVPPARLNPQVPRDLEAVCLRCLEKDPARRYASAAELAEDLGRFGRGEPTRARPVGRLERGAKWARRNRPLAASLAAGLLALTGGTAFSTYFAIDSAEQATQARNNETAALEAKNEFEQANTELEWTLARSLLRPLALEERQPFTDVETEALWELASSRRERLGPRFVEAALRGPLTSRQLKARAESALHAAVGLDPVKRANVEQLLAERLQDPQLDDRRRTDAAIAASALGDLRVEVAARVALVLLQAMAKHMNLARRAGVAADPIFMRELAPGLTAVADRLEPKVAADALHCLAQALQITSDPDTERELTRALSAVAARLGPQQAADLSQAMANTTNYGARRELVRLLLALTAGMEPQQAADTLIQDMAKLDDAVALHELAQGLSAVARRLRPDESARVADSLIPALTTEHPIPALRELAQGFAALAVRMEPAEATRVANSLFQATAKAPNSFRLPGLAQGVSVIATRVEPKDAGQVADSLTQTMAKTPDPFKVAALAQALSSVATLLKPEDATRVAQFLTRSMAKTDNPNALRELARALAAAAARLEPKDASRLCTQAADILIKTMAKMSHQSALPELVHGLSAVATSMEPRAAAQVADSLIHTMAKTPDPVTAVESAQALAAVATRLEPQDAGRVADALTQTMGKAIHPNHLIELARGLSGAADRLDPKDALRTADALIQIMTKTVDPNSLGELALGLSAVADRLKPKDAARFYTHAATTLTQAMTRRIESNAVRESWERLFSTQVAHLGPEGAAQVADSFTRAMADTRNLDESCLSGMALGWWAVAARLEPKDAARVADSLTQTMARTFHANPMGSWLAVSGLAKALRAVIARVDRKDASRLCAQVGDVLIQIMARNMDSRAKSALAEGFSAVAARMERKDAAHVAETITRTMAETNEPFALVELALALLGITSQLEPKAAADFEAKGASVVPAALTNVMVRSSGAYSPVVLEHVSAVATRLEPKHAAIVADTFTQAMAKATLPQSLGGLAEVLAALATRLEPNDASRLCAQASDTLIQAMVRTNPGLLPWLSRGLLAVAVRLSPEDRAQAADNLIQNMTKTTDPNALRELAGGLSAILTPVEPAQLSLRAAAVGSAVGLPAGTCLAYATLGLLGPALEPLPSRLSTRELVELLKRPTCIGQARRVILDQLETRYRSKFADHWAFVRFAQERNLGLDFTSPPKRLASAAADRGRFIPSPKEKRFGVMLNRSVE